MKPDDRCRLNPPPCGCRCAALPALLLAAFAAGAGESPYARWTNGPSPDPGFFPIAVWLQNPANAARYKQAGINTYVGLWRGPTGEQLAALKQAGMKVICGQSERSLRFKDDPTIIGWMHGDEPDNAQPLREGKGYGPPIAPEKIIADYERKRAADPSRPILLNLGQGVAYDNYIGRGVRRGRLEDYPEYIKGCDIVSFDIYPAVHDRPEVAGKLWYVARGVERLVNWSRGGKVVWNCLECTRIENPDRKPTPHEVRAEAWMSIIHGSRGLIWFVHQFKPVFREAALLDDAEMLAAVTAINRQITELAPVINGPALTDTAAVKSENADAPVAMTARRQEGALYVFAVAMRDADTQAAFTLQGVAGRRMVEVIGEGRTIEAKDGVFADTFGPWDVRLYRIRPEGVQ